MSEKSNTVGKTVVGAIVVAAILLPAGYVGLDFLRKDLRLHQAETRSVVMELKSATVEEIRASAGKTAEALKNANTGLNDGTGGIQSLATDMNELKRVTEEILTEQKTINAGLSKILDGASNSAQAPVAKPPREEAAFSESVYFRIGKASGPAVDKRIGEIVPEIRKHMTDAACRVDVTGFADTLGNDVNNLKLSRARANYVAQKLRHAKIDIYSVEAWGERRLKVHTYDGVKNESNRRADIEVHCAGKPKTTTAGS